MKANLGAHIEHSPVTSISKLAPYSALILSIVLLVLFMIRIYILEGFLLKKLHGSTYTQMDDTTRRSFLNHYIAAAMKLALIITVVYPFGAVVFGEAYFHTPYVHGSSITMGDLLVVGAQMFTGMFFFELLYRVEISPVSVIHHLATILVTQAAITISIEGASESSIEFTLCIIWGKQVCITHWQRRRSHSNFTHRCIRYDRRIYSSCCHDPVPCLS